MGLFNSILGGILSDSDKLEFVQQIATICEQKHWHLGSVPYDSLRVLTASESGEHTEELYFTNARHFNGKNVAISWMYFENVGSPEDEALFVTQALSFLDPEKLEAFNDTDVIDVSQRNGYVFIGVNQPITRAMMDIESDPALVQMLRTISDDLNEADDNKGFDHVELQDPGDNMIHKDALLFVDCARFEQDVAITWRHPETEKLGTTAFLVKTLIAQLPIDQINELVHNEVISLYIVDGINTLCIERPLTAADVGIEEVDFDLFETLRNAMGDEAYERYMASISSDEE